MDSFIFDYAQMIISSISLSESRFDLSQPHNKPVMFIIRYDKVLATVYCVSKK